MSDLFQEGVPLDFIDEVVARMLLAPRHTFQVLTKRAEAMRAYFAGDGLYDRIIDAADRVRVKRPDLVRVGISNPAAGAFRPWVWLGVSVEDRKHGLPRIEHLRETPAACRFLSVEPLLEDLGELDLRGIHWVIVGGESGHGARPCDISWIRSVVDQARRAGVAVFVKQLGADPVDTPVPGYTTGIPGIRHRKGGNPLEWPEDLRVQELPEVADD